MPGVRSPRHCCATRWRSGVDRRWPTWSRRPGWTSRPTGWKSCARGLRTLGETHLALGGDAESVAPLEALVGSHPLDEQACALLMLGLYGSGRQADALAAYRRLRRALLDELAVDPSPAVRDLESAILRHDASLE